MAIHNFNYTYEYVNCQTTFRNGQDDTVIIAQVTFDVTAVDQADDTKTITVRETRALKYGYLQSASSLPESFVQLEDVTTEQMLEWFKAGVSDADRDGYYTWQLYGHAEMDGT